MTSSVNHLLSAKSKVFRRVAVLWALIIPVKSFLSRLQQPLATRTVLPSRLVKCTATELPTAWCGFRELEAPLAFRSAHTIEAAYTIDEVLPALRRVEAAVRLGSHAVGMLAYESAPAFDSDMAVRPPTPGLPLLWFGLFNGTSITVEGWTYELPRAEDQQADKEGEDEEAALTSEWNARVGREAYFRAFGGVKEALRLGRSYQVNLALLLRASVRRPKDPRSTGRLMANLLRAQRSGYGAFLDLGRFKVLSASPELFFTWREKGGALTTRPMKGTAPRGVSASSLTCAGDTAAGEALRLDPKNRCENAMVVDLLRNDCSRVCRPGSIAVPRLFELERYPTVFQLTSTVTGETLPGVSLEGVLRALFPCASITGAPKLSTMSIIADLEAEPRGVYCGAILCITPEAPTCATGCGDGRAGPAGGHHTLHVTASVPIRTVCLDTQPEPVPETEESVGREAGGRAQSETGAGSGVATYGVGGGITWDSVGEEEYSELHDKSRAVRLASGLASPSLSEVPSPGSAAGAEGGGGGVRAGVGPAQGCSLGAALAGPPFALLETLRLDWRRPGVDGSTSEAIGDAIGSVVGGVVGESKGFAAGAVPTAAFEGSPSAQPCHALRDWRGAYARLHEHLERVGASAAFFGFAGADGARVRERAREALDAHAATHAAAWARAIADDAGTVVVGVASTSTLEEEADPSERPSRLSARPSSRRVRLLVHRSGEVEVGSVPLEADFLPAPAMSASPLSSPWPSPSESLPRVVLSPEPVDPANVFLYHKTTRRDVYDLHARLVREREVEVVVPGSGQGSGRGAFLDVLLWSHGNGGPFVTECSIGNLVVELEGCAGNADAPRASLVTPPVSAGLLAGVERGHALAGVGLVEGCISVDQVRVAKRTWLLNSVRGWVPVEVDTRLFDEFRGNKQLDSVR